MNSIYRHDLIENLNSTYKANRCLAGAISLNHSFFREHIGLDPKRINFSEGKVPAGRKIQIHRHQLLQLQLAISGKFLYSTSAYEYTIQSGELLFIHPEIDHGWRCQESGVLMGIEFDGIDQLNSGRWIEGFTVSKRKLLKSKDTAPDIMNACLEEIEKSDALRECRIAGLIQAWLCHLLSQNNKVILKTANTSKKATNERSMLEAAIAFIDANFDQPIDVAETAIHSGVSIRQLHRLFKCYHHNTPQKYLEEVRLQKGRELLVNSPTRRVKDIANIIGFSSENYFINRYKRRFGHTPGKKDKIEAQQKSASALSN